MNITTGDRIANQEEWLGLPVGAEVQHSSIDGTRIRKLNAEGHWTIPDRRDEIVMTTDLNNALNNNDYRLTKLPVQPWERIGDSTVFLPVGTRIRQSLHPVGFWGFEVVECNGVDCNIDHEVETSRRLKVVAGHTGHRIGNLVAHLGRADRSMTLLSLPDDGSHGGNEEHSPGFLAWAYPIRRGLIEAGRAYSYSERNGTAGMDVPALLTECGLPDFDLLLSAPPPADLTEEDEAKVARVSWAILEKGGEFCEERGWCEEWHNTLRGLGIDPEMTDPDDTQSHPEPGQWWSWGARYEWYRFTHAEGDRWFHDGRTDDVRADICAEQGSWDMTDDIVDPVWGPGTYPNWLTTMIAETEEPEEKTADDLLNELRDFLTENREATLEEVASRFGFEPAPIVQPDEPEGDGSVVRARCACQSFPHLFVRDTTEALRFAESPWRAHCGSHAWATLREASETHHFGIEVLWYAPIG